LGGGITSALRDYCASAPAFEHHLVFMARPEFNTSEGLVPPFDSAVPSIGGLATFRRRLVARYEELQPDIVHLHSAWAGVVGRTTAAIDPRHIIYTPHAFPFERTSFRPPVRWAAYQLERVLGRRTALLLGVSPYERSVGWKLGIRSMYLPNIARTDGHARRTRRARRHPEIITIGRVCAQKDPAFLVSTVRLCRELGVTANFTWIGDGDSKLVENLTANDVRVTGWLPRNQALQLLADADLYVHSAAWEGSPISLLEARALDVPVLARSIPSVESLGFPSTLKTPEALAWAISEKLTNQEDSAPAMANDLVVEEIKQAQSLATAYVRTLEWASVR
jgi:glycosyltransferase involved in cell wall biosynthesis